MIETGKIIPVVALARAEDVVPLAEALLAGGIRAIEITLRTDAGLAAIKAVHQAGLEIALGAGTITDADAMRRCRDAGAQFFVSPGATPELLALAQQERLFYLPGVVTPSEIIQALHYDQRCVKFFPAASFGGAALLKQYAAVFPQVAFCPTGGITPDNLRDFLSLPNVRCVGGTWLTPADALAARDWPRITRLARESLTAATV